MQIDATKLPNTVQIVQITDSHLGAAQGDQLLGMDSDASLEAVVGLIKEQQPGADLLLATGDLSSSGTRDSYRRFADATQTLASHRFYLPGNHDQLAPMEAALNEGAPLQRSIDIAGWQILLLDSRIPGEVGGNISASELTWLRNCLEASSAAHALICLHHHPVDIGCEWLDEQRVANADAFFDLLDEFEQVRGVLWGHVHQQLDTERKGVRLMSTPSSCIQFAPGQKNFKLDKLNPGYRWLKLHANGEIETAVERIQQGFEIDYDYTGGYE